MYITPTIYISLIFQMLEGKPNLYIIYIYLFRVIMIKTLSTMSG
jgi:hypothetical protein